MKRIIMSLIMLLAGNALMADEIYLSNGDVIRGKIIQVTDDRIEYDPEGARVFDVVEKSRVGKIRYDNGKVVSFALDTLYLADGSSVRCSVIRVTKDEIVYGPDGAEEQKTIPRDRVNRIEYSDGTKVDITGGKKEETAVIEEKDKNEETAIIEPKKQSGGFIDSWVRIAGFMGFGTQAGGILEREQRVLDAYRFDLMKAYVFPRDYQMYNFFSTGGGELDFLLPAVKFMQKRPFDLSGIKFGIRGRYGYEEIDSTIVDESSFYSAYQGYEMFQGRLMTYHYWAAGPVMNLVFSPRSNVFNFLLNFYAVAGQIFDGRVRAAAALRSARYLAWEMLGAAGPYGSPSFLPAGIANVTNTGRFNTARFNGYTVRIGFGPHFSLNKYAPVTIGVNATYAYSNIKLGRAMPIYYDGNKRATHHEFGGEVSVGFHIL
jgi:hypothetical protein